MEKQANFQFGRSVNEKRKTLLALLVVRYSNLSFGSLITNITLKYELYDSLLTEKSPKNTIEKLGNTRFFQ